MGRILRVHIEEKAKELGYTFDVFPGRKYKYELEQDWRRHTNFGMTILCETLQECWQELHWAPKPDCNRDKLP